jgi:hypothetical protein
MQKFTAADEIKNDQSDLPEDLDHTDKREISEDSL